MDFTVAGLLRHWAQATPDATMFVQNGRQVSWAEHDQFTNRLAQALKARGVGPADRVAYLDRNGIGYFEVLFAAAKLNAVVVGVNWRLTPFEARQIIADSTAKVVFCGAEFTDAAGDPDRAVVIDGDSYRAWSENYAAADPNEPVDARDVVLQLYTSGTTGIPKGVLLTNANFEAALPPIGQEMGIRADSRMMVALPLFHIGGAGTGLIALCNGATSIIVRDPDPEVILRTLDQQRITHAFLVPALIMFLLSHPATATANWDALEAICYGAAPISPDLLERAVDTFGCRFLQTYGATETTGAVVVLRPDQHDPKNLDPLRLQSCGVPLDGVEVRIRALDDAADAPVGVPGEVWIRSAQNMLGYWNQPAATAETITPDGWLRTGDVAYRDPDGYLYLCDRVKDVIVTGGENVYPAEVEKALLAHPEVADCAVIGVPSERWGETVKAIAVRTDNSDVSDHDLLTFARERLAGFKIPRSVDFVDELPRNASGKILKRELREPFWAGHARRIG